MITTIDSIDWEVMVVTLIALLVLGVLAAIAVFYVRHWVSRHESSVCKPKEGRYFKRHLPEHLQQAQEQQQRLAVQRKQKSLQRWKWGISIVVVVLVVFATVTSLYVNRDTLQAKIILTDEEKQQIVLTKHQWTPVYAETLPSLDKQLAKVKRQGLVLVGHKKNTDNPVLNRLKENAKTTWMTFGRHHKLATITCDWQNVQRCQTQFTGWLFIVLPDYWPRNKLDQLLSQGESVLLYDVPFQVADKKIDKKSVDPFSLYGLRFTAAVDKSYSVLTLVGDSELSLGFDAGTIIDIGRYSYNYYATSNRPQALAIDSGHAAGAKITTRLYAQTIGKGRFVWMDFSPNLVDHASGVNPRYFKGVLAAIFRYLNKESYQALASWPEGHVFAALIEEDTEDQYTNAERVTRYFAKNKYPITWYILANEAQKNRALTRAMAESGEIACHGDHHRPFTQSDVVTQHQRIALCRKALYEITGKTVHSFRPPEEKYNDDTLDALINNNISYSIAEHSVDRFVPTILKSQQTGKTLVSLPRMVSDDFVLWYEMDADQTRSLKITTEEVDYVKAVKGLYIFSFHTQFMDDNEHFYVVKALAYRLHQENAFFATTRDIAHWWEVRTSLASGQFVDAEDIQRFKPVVLSVGQDGKLLSKPF